MVTPGIEVRPLSDNYYGWAKEVYEHLGFVFAVGKANATACRGGIQAMIQSGGATLTEREQGRPLENVQIRIGGPRARPT